MISGGIKYNKVMNKIVSVVFVFLQSAFLACCNGCNQSPAPSYDEDIVKEDPQELVVNTVREINQVKEENKDEPVSPASSSVSSSRSSSSYGSSSSYRHKEKEPDNMRGFDPPSEDDMDDNGMSRYMENNDDKGWE